MSYVPVRSLLGVNRVCPGMYLADSVGFQIASALAALYDVVPLEGRSRPEPESVEYTDWGFRFVGCSRYKTTYIEFFFFFLLIRVPKTFECRFVARNAKTEELLKMSHLGD